MYDKNNNVYGTIDPMAVVAAGHHMPLPIKFAQIVVAHPLYGGWVCAL
jgi:hypothetical protein